ncbi:MAG: polyhydroxyalkanoate synthesis repressor PhaR [Rhodospirillales bacterium]|nr:polyhydroxyalkanoate synthesis repressor PhaR [Rhodospirillales bacterium]
MSDSTDAPPAGPCAKITIKKYANRRLYNTATSCYVTLDYLANLVKAGADFAVYDARSGDDITRSVLTHIIVEEEAKGQSMLPVSFLRNLISFYGDSLQVVVPRYLEHSMQAFSRNQEQMREYMAGAFDGLNPFTSFEEMSKQQLAMFERAVKMFSPFHVDELATPDRSEAQAAPQADKQIDELRARLNEMQRQLDALVARRGDAGEKPATGVAQTESARSGDRAKGKAAGKNSAGHADERASRTPAGSK